MIKAVLFDFGGVLSEGGKVGAVRQIFAQAYGIAPESLRFDNEGLKAMRGQISDDDFIAAMNLRHPQGQPVTKGQFVATVDHLVPSDPVYDLVKGLRQQGIKTGIVSNTFAITAESLREKGLYEGFDPVLLSCDTHLAKPDHQFYELALERLGLPASEVLFIDDSAPYIEAAAKLGMHTILATSPEQIVADAKDILSKENGLQL